MLGKTLFLSLGLIAAVTLGCEKKSETPEVPPADAVETAVDEHAEDAVKDAGKAVEDAADKAGDAADEVKDAAKDVKLPE